MAGDALIALALITWLAIAAFAIAASELATRGDAGFHKRSRRYLEHVEASWRDATRTRCECADCKAFRVEMGWPA